MIGLIVFPYLGVFIYLISQSRGMAERRDQRVEEARGELRQIFGFSVADEIEKLERLKNSGAISSEEYARLRAGDTIAEVARIGEAGWRALGVCYYQPRDRT